MNKLLLLLPLMLAAQIASAQNDALTRFFNQYTEDERFTMVYVSPKMFELLAKIETDDPDWNNVRDVVADLKGLRVLSTSDTLIDGMQLYKDALSRVPAAEYVEMLTVRDGKTNVRFMIRESGNIIEELLLLVGGPGEFVLLDFTGSIDLDKISRMSKALDIKGTEHLNKLKNKEKD